MRTRDLTVTLLTLTLLAGCKTSEKVGPPPPIPQLPNYSGMADQIVSWMPEKGTAVALAYMDLSQVAEVQGKQAAEEIRKTYPDRMDVYLANASRNLFPKKSIRVVDRRNMTHFLAEQKLQASDMVPFDPTSRVKLRKVTAVNTYVYWKIVREGDIEEWILRAVAVETGEVLGGLVHRFRLPEEFKVQPRVGDLTIDSFHYDEEKDQFRLALQGNVKAMVRIGDVIYRHQGRMNNAKYFDPQVWYVRAGEAGYAEGFYRAGMLYYEPYKYSDTKKVKNWVTARTWLEKAADLGHVKATTKLGWMHHHGEGTAVDLVQARAFYLKGAQGGDSTAMNQIGYLLRNGKGGDVDLKSAAHWYRQAATNGSAIAASNLGYLYETGQGVTKDLNAAVRWYRKAAWGNYGTGMTNLGQMYEHGKGVPKDLFKARDWYSKARKNGCRKAYDHWVRVNAQVRKVEVVQEREKRKRIQKVRAATWVVIPHSLKMYSSSYNPTNYNMIATLKKGQKLHVLIERVSGSSGKWTKVLWEGREGYVRAGLLKMIEPDTEPKPAKKDPTVKTSTKKSTF